MAYVFCTLFDKNYLYRGLALYHSLLTHSPQSTLWVLCMDELSHTVLDRLHLERMHLVQFDVIGDEGLDAVRTSRSPAELCWSSTASWLQFVQTQLPTGAVVAYVDADLFFCSTPEPIFAELGDQSILIHEHRFAPQYKSWEATSGTYNVGLVAFRNDPIGHECLAWWRTKCLDACALDPTNGYCGDQKYLDDWPTRFPGVAVLQHKGGGLAPWNVANYTVQQGPNGVTVDGLPLIFYHFHSLQQTDRRIAGRRLAIASRNYTFTRRQVSLIYGPYVRALAAAAKSVRAVAPDFHSGLQSAGWRELFKYWLRGSVLLA